MKTFAFYYPWYGTRPYRHWKPDPNSPDTRLSNSPRYPSLGLYHSGHQSTLDRHFRWARSAGLNGFVVSWWGQGSFEDRQILKILKTAAKFGLQISLYYERVADSSQDNTNTTRESRILADLKYLSRQYAAHPAYYKRDTKPVLFLYRRALQSLKPLSRWKAIVKSSSNPFLIIADGNTPVRSNIFQATHTYNPVSVLASLPKTNNSKSEIATRLHRHYNHNSKTQRQHNQPVILTVAKGYDDRLERPESGFYLSSDNSRLYHTMWLNAMAFDPDIVLITSWNEWHEGTEIEPSREEGNVWLELTRLYTKKLPPPLPPKSP